MTERRSPTRIIQQLHDIATDLMDAATRPEIADITTEAAEVVIDYSIATVRLAREDGRLELVSMTADTEAIFSDGAPTYAAGEGFIGRAYASGEPSIVDDGPGIAPERRESIFERGETGQVSTGSGFGLFFVSSMIDSYGGDVRVEASDRDGASFALELPRA